ncbi:hypothetical protein [Stutzerimonas zhaodongensis]|uniref:hypothetical protein n=1 Tax=Stutzerimonas TaxID=2901164 RepID=UPI00389064AA
MTTGLDQIPNDAARLHLAPTDSPVTPDVGGAYPALTDLHPLALRIGGLLLTFILTGMIGTALAALGQPAINQGAKAMPLLQMMTEKPARHVIH